MTVDELFELDPRRVESEPVPKEILDKHFTDALSAYDETYELPDGRQFTVHYAFESSGQPCWGYPAVTELTTTVSS